MSSIAIKAENLSKCYRIGLKEKSSDTFFGAMGSWLRSPLNNFRQLHRLSNFNGDPHDQEDVIWALKDLCFEVEHSEVLGLIGQNGSGKSTLLKIISRITEPTRGRVVINGRVASLLEVGTGFHPELSGRENIYLNGTILGMNKAEIDRKFDEIVDFSGVEKFIDTPVKRYSSGMHVRLAFSVAAHLEPEILLIDEVLAVGDAAFQKKCLGKMGEVASAGRTVLFVSHNLEAIRGLCHRAIWIGDGEKKAEGDVVEVVQEYYNTLMENTFFFENKDHGLVIKKVTLKNTQGEESSQFSSGEDLIVEINYSARKTIEKPYIILNVQGINGHCFAANMLLDGNRPAVLEGHGRIACRFKSIPLLPQSYSVRMAIKAKDANELILNYLDVTSFSVEDNLEKFGYQGEFRKKYAPTSVSVVIPYEWELPDGTTTSIALGGSYGGVTTPIKSKLTKHDPQ